MKRTARLLCRTALLAFAAAIVLGTTAKASDFSEPWKSADRALVIDAYEYNSIDWAQLATDKRIVAFINKASDGMPPPYFCFGGETDVKLCKALWKRHAVTRELFQTRRVVAKALGMKWGAYHLARPGNPVEQANNFLDFADPAPDDLMALDIEGIDPSQWMSLDDAEEFARQVHRRIGRFPVLYTNGKTAQYIADNRYKYRLLRGCRFGTRAISLTSTCIFRWATGRATRSGSSRRRPIAAASVAPTGLPAHPTTSTSTWRPRMPSLCASNGLSVA